MASIAARLAALGPLDPDAARWANAVRAAGSSVSLSRLAVVSQFVIAEKASGAWQRTDDYLVFWAENAIQALMSLKQLRLATAVNSPSFTADRGFLFDGATNYLNTGFIPRTHGIRMTGTDMRIAAYERTNVSGSSAWTAGARNNSSVTLAIRNRYASAMTATLCNSLPALDFPISPADSRGLKAASRAGGGATAVAYDRGVRLADITGLTIGSVLPNVSIFVGCYNNGGTPTGPRAGFVGFLAVGAPLSDAQELSQYNNAQAWASAVGAQV